ncbi:hypothetical protein ABZ791_00450 [Streptomyces huasconensis]|uniref:Uncharacterized protein n=1 Tax=Streptomyces huasconensis TaxID=1854574 RepID=A0ABV3LSJ9_9ACTN
MSQPRRVARFASGPLQCVRCSPRGGWAEALLPRADECGDIQGVPQARIHFEGGQVMLRMPDTSASVPTSSPAAGARRCRPDSANDAAGRSPTGAPTGQVGVTDGLAYAHTGQRAQPASRTAASTSERSGPNPRQGRLVR